MWFIVLFTISAYSQHLTLVGTVRDGTTKDPLSNVRVIVKELGTVTQTDSLGHFTIPSLSAGWYTLSLLHPNYQKYEHRLFIDNDRQSIALELPTPLFHMPAVVVQSVRSPADIQESPYPVAYIDGSRFIDAPAQTLPEELNRTPGITLVRDGMWATTVNIRGLHRYDIVTLHDGVRIETAQDLAAGLALINPYDIDRIEVVKGPSHASTGTIGGVVLSLGKYPSFTDQFRISWEAMGRYESVNNLHGEHCAFELTSDVVRIRASGMYRNAESYRTPQGVMPNSQFTDFNGSFFVGTKVFSSHLLNATYQRSQAENVGIPGGKSIASTATATYKLARREFMKAEYIIPNLSPYIPRIHFHIARQTIQRNVQLIASPTLTKTPHALHTLLSAQGEVSFVPAEQHFATAGIEYWQRTVDSKRESYDARLHTVTLERPLPDASYKSGGLFFQDEWRILPLGTTLTIGGRYDAIRISNPTTYNIDWVLDSLGRRTIPATRQLLWREATRTTESWSLSAGLHQNVGGGLKMSFLLALAERTANIEERFQYLTLGRTTFLGNPDLAPEKSYNTNVNILWQTTSLRVVAELYSHFFVNLISDTLIFATPTTQTFSKYNIRRAKTYGYEFTVEYTPIPSLMFLSTASYTRGEDFSHKTNLPQIPPLKGTFSTQYSAPQYGTFTLEWEGVSSQENVAARTAGETRTGGYALLHFSYKSTPFHLFATTATVRCGVQNIFNRAYQHHLSTLRILKLEPGRNVWCSLTLEQ